MRTDTTKLIVAFRNFAKAPKNLHFSYNVTKTLKSIIQGMSGNILFIVCLPVFIISLVSLHTRFLKSFPVLLL